METQNNPSRPALPLVALLALAAALGVAVAVALAGVAMLLAAPVYAHAHVPEPQLPERCRYFAGTVELELAVLTLLHDADETPLRVELEGCARRGRRVFA